MTDSPVVWQEADQAEFFATLDKQSTTHWWHRSRRAMVVRLINDRCPAPSTMLDVGCGVGTMVESAVEAWPGSRVVGAEYSLDAVMRAASKGRNVVASAAENLPITSGTAAVITSLDVIEHLDDDVVALAEYRRCMSPTGTLVLTVPAYQFLWGRHDEILGHRRRYSRKALVAAVEAAGFSVDFASHYMTFLVPAAALMRRTPLRRLISDTGEEASYVNPTVNRLLLAVCRAEAWLMRRFPLPFGLSIVLVAHPDST